MKIFYAASTHWDREWYKPFQGFRYDLIKMTDKLIDALENDMVDVFTFDGQSVVIEDYLEIRPYNKERIAELIKAKKLKIGPWYVMPDELLVSGESIIRNFLTGKSIAEYFCVQPWRYGYMNDIFGHIAQMPQILKGIGINTSYLGRGVGRKNQDYSNFVWESPDGSSIYSYKETYANLKGKFVSENSVEDYLKQKVDKTNAVIMLYTDDHGTIDENALNFQKFKKQLAEKYELVEGLENIEYDLEKFKDELPREKGELITTGETRDTFRAVTHSISSYYSLKRENDICENLLENKISPMLAMAKIKGIDVDSEFYKLAYKYLLKNQPHDSICGCSSATVHSDMFYRYSQVHSIANAMSEDFEKQLKSGEISRRGFKIEVINFDLNVCDGVFTVDIDFPQDWECKLKDNARYQQYNGFSVLDEAGNELPYQILEIKKDYLVSEKPYAPKTDRYTVAIKGKLNAFGTTVFSVVAGNKPVYIKTYSDGELTAENEFIRINISCDGTVDLTDKEKNIVYNGLNTFIDDGEIGNGWFSEAPLVCNNMISSKGSETTIEIVKRGNLVNSFRVTKIMKIPKKVDYNTYTRSEECESLKLVSDITLRAGCKYVEFETTVNNNVKDHRLRVEFPTGTEGEKYKTSQAFTFVERKRGVTYEGAQFAEPEAYEKNTGGIVSVANVEKGLSFISKEGIHECGVSNNGVITATMLRCFGRMMFDNIENSHAQLQGVHKFRYALSTETCLTALVDIKKKMMEKYTNVFASEDRLSSSLMEAKGDVAISIVKKSEDGRGIVIRVYNPSEKSENFTVNSNVGIKNACIVNLYEEKISSLDIRDGKISMDILPEKIETVFIEF